MHFIAPLLDPPSRAFIEKMNEWSKAIFSGIAIMLIIKKHFKWEGVKASARLLTFTDLYIVPSFMDDRCFSNTHANHIHLVHEHVEQN